MHASVRPSHPKASVVPMSGTLVLAAFNAARTPYRGSSYMSFVLNMCCSFFQPDFCYKSPAQRSLPASIMFNMCAGNPLSSFERRHADHVSGLVCPLRPTQSYSYCIYSIIRQTRLYSPCAGVSCHNQVFFSATIPDITGRHLVRARKTVVTNRTNSMLLSIRRG